LVNPEREIQPFVVNLTGINSNMLKNAPKFYEVAKRIVEITEDCIIVAHNSQFDYRILRTEFKRLGFEYKRKTLCTVELSQQLIPDQDSYSLGKLARALGIPVNDRHRADGDAIATVKLFKMLLSKDLDKVIITEKIKAEVTDKMQGNLQRILEDLPSSTGVYYIHNKNGDIIYIGKSRNIKNRVNQHFTNTSSRSKKLQLQVASVTYEPTGNELIALLKENEEIRRNKPKYNRAIKQTTFHYGLYQFIDANGYINLNITKINHEESPIITFTNKQSGISFMLKNVKAYNLCQKLTGLYKTDADCYNYKLNTCEGACVNEEPTESYNKRVNELISKYDLEHKNVVIVDKGREVDERSAILIKDGVFAGFGFYNLNHQINTISVLESFITPMPPNNDTKHIIQSYIRKNKNLKIIDLIT